MDHLKFYETEQGNCPVETYVDEMQDLGNRASIDKIFEKIDEQGAKYLTLGVVNSKPMQGIKGLFEIKVSVHRFFYVYGDGQSVWVLHAVRKQQAKTEAVDKEICIQRIRELKERKLISK